MDNQLMEAELQLKELAMHFKKVFSDYSGQQVMANLEAMTAVSTLSGNNMMDAQANVNATDFMMMREGQNMVVRYLKRMIAMGEN